MFGYEESYGYLCGTHARDKDTVFSSMLICEMAAEAKSQNKTLIDKLNDIYNEYGYYKDVLESFTLKGKDGVEKINEMMSTLRNNVHLRMLRKYRILIKQHLKSMVLEHIQFQMC